MDNICNATMLQVYIAFCPFILCLTVIIHLNLGRLLERTYCNLHYTIFLQYCIVSWDAIRSII